MAHPLKECSAAAAGGGLGGGEDMLQRREGSLVCPEARVGDREPDFSCSFLSLFPHLYTSGVGSF